MVNDRTIICEKVNLLIAFPGKLLSNQEYNRCDCQIYEPVPHNVLCINYKFELSLRQRERENYVYRFGEYINTNVLLTRYLSLKTIFASASDSHVLASDERNTQNITNISDV